MQERHSLELRVQELEIKQQSLVSSKDQIAAELEETRTLLRAEQDQRSRKEAELSNKEELQQALQEEMKKIVEERTRLSATLDNADQNKATLESKVYSSRQFINYARWVLLQLHVLYIGNGAFIYYSTCTMFMCSYAVCKYIVLYQYVFTVKLYSLMLEW